MKKSLLLVFILLCAWFVQAQVPQTISYQGILVNSVDGTPVIDGSSHSIRFVFYDHPTVGTIKYETQSYNVTTYKGLFTTIIGNELPSPSANPIIPLTIWDQPIYVEVIANAAPLGARIPLTSAAFAFKAHSANTMDAAGLTGSANLPNAVLDADLQDLADGSLTGSKVGTGIDATNISTGTLPIARIADNAITNAKLADNAVNTADIADNAVTTAEIGTAGVTDASKVLATDANGDPLWFAPTNARTLLGVVIGTNVQAYSANLDDLSDGSLTGSKVGTGIDAANITTGTLPIARIADDAITIAKIGTAGVPDAGKILTTDVSGNPVWTTAGTGVVALTASNGLTLTGNNVGLGGNLTGNVTIPTAGNSIFLTGTGGIGIASGTTAFNKFEVGGNVAIGNSYAGIISAPANGLIVQNVVGIGTSAPVASLDIIGDGSNGGLNGDIQMQTSSATNHSVLNINRSQGIPTTPTTVLASDILGRIHFNGYTGSAYSNAGSILSLAETSFNTAVNGALIFSTTSSGTSAEKMRIASTGNVGIGTTTPAAKLDVNGTAVFRGYTGINRTTPVGASAFDVEVTATAGNYGGMYVNSTTATSYPFYGYATAGTAKGWTWINGSTGTWALNLNSGDRLAVTSAGNVGIGTTAPAYPLQVINSTNAKASEISQSYSGGVLQTGLTIDMTSGTGTSSKYGIDCNVVGTAGSSGFVYGLETDITPNGSGSHYGLNSVIANNATGTGARIAVYGLSYSGSAAANSSNIYGVYGYGYSTSTNHSGTVYGVYGTTVDGGGSGAHYAVYANGDMAYTGSITDVSDRKLKKDIQSMPSMMPKLMQLKPSTYFYRSDEFKFMNLPTESQLGLIAQEVEVIFPEAVTDNQHPGELGEDGNPIGKPFDYKGVDYTVFIPVLIKGMQEQQTQIDELKAQVEELKKLVTAQLNSKPSTSETASATTSGTKK